MTGFQTATFVAAMIWSGVMVLAVGSLFGGRHRRRRLPVHAFFPMTGLWEIGIGLFILAMGPAESATGPLMLGVMFVVGWVVWYRVLRKLTP